MVKTYQQVNREQHEREREEHHERKHRKYTLLIIVALLVAFFAIMLAQNAQDTADINNVFEIVVNNTNLAPSVAGHPPGTGERVSGTTYWANNSPIEVFVFAHATSAGQNAEIHLFINNTKVADTSGRPLGGAEESNKTIIAIIPKGANYSFEFNNAHHYEWREYPVLSGKNGTLSINQTITGNYVNKTGDTMTGLLNASANINTTLLNVTNPVYFDYDNRTSSPSVPNNLEWTINYTTKNSDTYNAFNGTAFIAPVGGYYSFDMTIRPLGATGTQSSAAYFVKNGIIYYRCYSTNTTTSLFVSSCHTIIPLNTGDSVDTRFLVIGSGISLYGDTTNHYSKIIGMKIA